MKIAILTPTFNYYSGVDRVAQDKAEKFVKEGHKVTIFAFESKIKPKGYEIKDLGMPKNPFVQRLYRLFFSFISKDRLIKKLKGYDKIISFYYPMDELALQAKKRYKIKYVAWLSGVAPGENFLENIYMNLFKLFYYNCIKHADEIICVSNFVKNKLIKETGVRAEIVDTIYNEIDNKRFNKNVKKVYKNKISNLIKKYNLKDKKVFLYVGRLATSKRVALLIKMYKMKKNEFPESKLIIIGKPTFKGYFKKLLSMADEDIIFTGVVDDKEIPAYYAVSDVYVTASSDEGFNLPAVEAQACGVPVIAFDIGSHKEVITKGTLVPEGDCKGFTDSWVKYANSI